MDRKAFKAEIKVNWPCIPAVMCDEQYSFSTIKVLCFSFPETSSVAITGSAAIGLRLSLLVFLKAGSGNEVIKIIHVCQFVKFVIYGLSTSKINNLTSRADGFSTKTV